MSKTISWEVKCLNCGFEFSVIFDADEDEETRKILKGCPCGGKVKIIKESVYDDE